MLICDGLEIRSWGEDPYVLFLRFFVSRLFWTEKNTRIQTTQLNFSRQHLDSPDWEASEERQIARGEELTFLYGQFSDAQLLCNYGICPDLPGRSHDVSAPSCGVSGFYTDQSGLNLTDCGGLFNFKQPLCLLALGMRTHCVCLHVRLKHSSFAIVIFSRNRS